MKVILSENVEKLGKVGDVVTVAPGYFRNYLQPKKLASEATQHNIQRLEKRKRAAELEESKEKNAAEAVAEKLKELKVVMKLKAGENDRLFGSVTNHDVQEKLAQMGYDIDKKKIHLAEPIKSLGEFTVDVKLHPEVTAQLPVVVEKEE